MSRTGKPTARIIRQLDDKHTDRLLEQLGNITTTELLKAAASGVDIIYAAIEEHDNKHYLIGWAGSDELPIYGDLFENHTHPDTPITPQVKYRKCPAYKTVELTNKDMNPKFYKNKTKNHTPPARNTSNTLEDDIGF